MHFVFLSALALAQPAEIPWHTSPATAAAVARAQQKMLFVYYRAACESCNAETDALLAKAAGDSSFTVGMDSFLPLRLTDGSAPQHPISDDLVESHKGPLVAFYDAAGVQLSVVDKPKEWKEIAEEMLRVRAVRGMVATAVALRLNGQEAAADYATGRALLGANRFVVAAGMLGRAAAAFRDAGDMESAQLADVHAGTAWHAANQKVKGRTIISDILRKPVSDVVAAEAHVAYAGFEEEASQWARRQRGPARTSGADRLALRRAVDAYRRAYEVAAPGSDAHETARLALARLDDRPLPEQKKGDAPSLRITAPARLTLTGNADFVVQAQDGITRVDLFLDERKVASAEKRPFRMSADVGPTPRVRTIKAVGFDAAGKAKGEALLTINDRQDALQVSIIAPAEDAIAGTANVELDVKVPPGRKLARIELSWNEQLVATLKVPPYRAPLKVEGGEFGYLRAMAVLDDGTSAETTRIYNATGVSESVDVATVTVIATVADADGKRIAGLRQGDFTVEDHGTKVAVTLQSSEEDPVTIGIAIDSSQSMSATQLYTGQAAAELVRQVLRPQDEAFLVSFDMTPRLTHRRTHDAASLQAAIYDVVPKGATSMFDGVTFALQQFQGIPGKKALLVYTDGYEGTSTASAAECDRLARTLGVPVYVLVPPGGERQQHALRQISQVTGGRMLHATPEEELSSVYRDLAEELRGQYVLTFSRPSGVTPGEWRPVRVTVSRPEARVRTIQGYRAQ